MGTTQIYQTYIYRDEINGYALNPIYILLPNVLSKITWIMNLKEINTLFNFIIKYCLLVSQVNLYLQNLFNN